MRRPGRFPYGRVMTIAAASFALQLAAELPLAAQSAAATRSGSGSSSSGSASSGGQSSGQSSGSSSGTASRGSSSGSSAATARATASSSSSSQTAVRGTSRSQRELRSAWRGRDRSPSNHGHHHYYPGYSSSWFWGPSWSWGWWPAGYGYYGRFGYPYGYWGGPAVVYVGGSGDYVGPGSGMAALDLDVKPEEAQVWVDGGYVGEADDFDGFPSYLWLAAGEHEIVLYSPGRETLVRTVNLRDGEMLGFDDALPPGVSRAPQEVFTRFENNTAAAIAEGRVASDEEELEPGMARLRILVSPADAAVWLDGRPIGSAAELADLHDALAVTAGSHEIVAVRPGWGELRRRIEVAAGEDAEIELSLD